MKSGVRKVSKYPPISTAELLEILATTIKYDDDNKLIAFLAMLSAYTEDSQLNLSFNAPSSAGKSFIPTEIAALFPSEDVIELGYASPTSFIHGNSEFDKEKQQYTVDLERKIIIFLDQPHSMLLEHLRPLLSHDKKEILLQVTDKSQKHGLKTKKVILRGYPAVVFCTAGLQLDEQEATRFLLLSPEISQEKLHAGVVESLRKDADKEAYWNHMEINPPRQRLRGRIEAIKTEDVSNIRITDDDRDYIEKRFFSKRPVLKPRHQRDIKRLVSLIKIFALLNLWDRKREGTGILATKHDVDEAFEIWDRIAIPQELNIPPYVYRLYEDVILASYKEKNAGNMKQMIGVSRQEVMDKHYEVNGRYLNALVLRQQIIPMLKQAGLISEEFDIVDRRNKLIYPHLTINNSESGGGLKKEVSHSDFNSMMKDMHEENHSEVINKELETVTNIFGGGELLNEGTNL